MHLQRRKDLLKLLTVALAAPSFCAPGALAQSSPSGAGLEEIVVTALKRDTRLLDAPVAISVFTDTAIANAGITRPADFITLVPNVTLVEANHAGEALITIRGIAQNRGADATVAVVIDGVQLATANEFNQELYDIQQIEVVKGPQGALYGRNAIGGAIVITTQPPSNEWSGSVMAGYGNGDSVKAVASLSGPLIEDKLSGRISAFHRETDGFHENVYLGENVDYFRDRGVRLRFDFTPTEDFRLDVRGAMSEVNGGAITYLPQIGLLDTNDTSGEFEANVRGNNIQKKYSASVKAEWDTSAGTITFIPAFAQIKDIYEADQFPYSRNPEGTQHNEVTNESYTAELRFTSPSEDRFRYIAGAYYANIRGRQSTATGADTGGGIILPGRGPHSMDTINPTLAYTDDKNKNDVYAVFGQLAFDVTERFEILGAFRYDRENRRQTNIAPEEFSDFSGNHRKKKFKEFQPKVTLRYTASDNISLYADYAHGFVSGGFNPAQTRDLVIISDPNATVQNEYGKQTSRAAEIGFKSQFWDRRINLNGAAFYTKVENLQQYLFFPQATLQAIDTIDKATIKGFEFDVNAMVTDEISLFGGFGYTDGKIKKLSSAPQFVGNSTPYVPDYTLVVGTQYERPITTDLTGLVRVEYERRGSQWWDFAETPGTKRKPIDLVNVRATLDAESWSFSLWSRNLFDLDYNAEAIVLISPIVQVVHPAPPRTYGAEFKVRF